MSVRALRSVLLGLLLAVSTLVAANDRGPAPDTLPQGVLLRLVPEVKRPRVLTERDLRNDDDREEYARLGWKFFLFEDLDLDGAEEIIVAGRFDNPRNEKDTAFVLVASKHGRAWTRRLFLRPGAVNVYLKAVAHPDPVRAQRGSKAIIASMTVMGSDDYVLIYWDGLQYRYQSGFDIVVREIEKAEKAPSKSK